MAKKEVKIEEDYYLDNLGRVVFTKEYHLKRGYCCSPLKEKGCVNCPYRPQENEKKS